MGKHKFECSDFINVGCKLSELPNQFYYIWKNTNQDPCTTGCAYYHPKAKCYKAMAYKEKAAREASKPAVETNAQIAERLKKQGYEFTKRQISKMRKSGELEELLKNPRKVSWNTNLK